MNPQRDGRVKTLLGGFLLSLVLLVGIAAFGLFAALSALASAATGAPLVFVALDALAPYLAASMLVGVLSFVLLLGTMVAAIRRLSMPRNERLARVARGVEFVSPRARSAGLAERFEPTTEERIADLKQEYVAGEIGEREFERRMRDLLDDREAGEERDSVVPRGGRGGRARRVRHERRRVDRDRRHPNRERRSVEREYNQ